MVLHDSYHTRSTLFQDHYPIQVLTVAIELPKIAWNVSPFRNSVNCFYRFPSPVAMAMNTLFLGISRLLSMHILDFPGKLL